jgi:hypothetical protein
VQDQQTLRPGEVPEQGQQERGHDLRHVHSQNFPGKITQGAQVVNLTVQGIVLFGQFGVEQFDTRSVKGKAQAGLKQSAQPRHKLPVLFVIKTSGKVLFQAKHPVLSVVQRADQKQFAFSGAELALQGRDEIGRLALLAQCVEMVAQHPGIFRSQATGET